jgi:hypothetical protein
MNDNGWWFVESGDGASGWVPSSYLDRMEPEEIKAEEIKIEEQKIAEAAAAAAPKVYINPDPHPELAFAEGDGACACCKRALGGDYVRANGKGFHEKCFVCVIGACDLGEGFVEKMDSLFCVQHYHEEFSPKCGGCLKPITGKHLKALEKQWHSECFTCMVCKKPFPGGAFHKHDNLPYCEEHFLDLFGTKCGFCGKPVVGKCFEALKKVFHPDCFA